MKISYNWLKWYVPELPEADKLWDVFTFHLCEVESVTAVIPDLIRDPGGEFKNVNLDSSSEAGMTHTGEPEDWIFDINILPNRAHDLLSHQGVAQELSAICDIPFNSPVEMYKIPESKPTELSIKIESDKCRRYMGRIVRNVKVGPSPDWVVKHLESIGQKSINNVVDATNIVLFDCGQPTHVFDAGKLKASSGKSQVEIRIQNAKDGEKIQLLGGEEKELQAGDLVIACPQESASDPHSSALLAIAGVKGGMHAEVDANTTDIVLEVANFDPVSTRKTGRRLSLFTDALKRFENDLSPVRAEYAMTELSALIVEMCPEAVFEDIVDVFPDQDIWTTPNKIGISLFDINRTLGTEFTGDEIESVWKRMQFEYTRDADDFVVTIPLLRLDLVGRHDLVEEVGRVLGYDRVVPQLPKIPFASKVNDTMYRILAARKKLVEDGYREVMTYSLVKKGPVEIARAPKGKEAMRSNLSDGLKVAYEQNRLNAPLLEQSEIKIFEIGDVYPSEGEEVTHLAWADKKGIQEMTLAEFTKDIVLGDSYNELLSTGDLGLSTGHFVAWSLFPFIYRDISMWVPAEVESEKVGAIIKDNAGNLVVKGPTLIDSFSKDGRTSLAYRLVFQAMDRTLTDEEVSVAMERVTQALVAQGFEIR